MNLLIFFPLLSEFDFNGYLPLIMNIKKEVVRFLLMLGYQFDSWQCSSKMTWQNLSDLDPFTIFFWSGYHFFLFYRVER